MATATFDNWTDARAALVRVCTARGMSAADSDDAAQDLIVRTLARGEGPAALAGDLAQIVRHGTGRVPAVQREARRSALVGIARLGDDCGLIRCRQPGPELVAMAHEAGIPTD